MKSPILQLSATSYHFVPLPAKYSPQQPVLKFFIFRDQVSHTYETAGKILVLRILISAILRSRQEDVTFRLKTF
jgi:hypothetical protein